MKKYSDMFKIKSAAIIIFFPSLIVSVDSVFSQPASIEPDRALSISVSTYASGITTSGITINWQTDVSTSGYILYGKTELLELGTLSSTETGTTHSVSITGANPAEVYYAKIFSVAGVDTASTPVKVFITSSLSSGEILCYFNSSVDTGVSLSPSNYATRLQNLFDDTLAAYIDRAQSTLDIAIYNFDNVNTSAIITAINSAYTRGVKIRIISEGGNANNALNNLNASIPKLSSPTGLPYGIMHNKFMIVDPFTSNPDDAVLWTGATNWSNTQLYTDANDIIIFHDQSIARTYRLEFNEMWGDTGMTPNLANSRFGPYKTDNTPHQFVIGGKNVECYFSPSDGVTSKIINTINSTDALLCFSILAFTRSDIASAVAARANAGVPSYGMVEDTGSGGGNAFLIMQPPMNNRLRIDNQSRILHHKYLIADQNSASLDPLVLTGSHNWSTSAETKNDENTVIVHDQAIANQYFQEFAKRFTEIGGVIGIAENEQDDFLFSVYPNPANQYAICSWQLAKTENVKFSLCDISGREIHVLKNEKLSAGNYSEKVNLKNVEAGIYFLWADAGKPVVVKLVVY